MTVGDLIRREDAINALEEWIDLFDKPDDVLIRGAFKRALKEIRKLPAVKTDREDEEK